MSSPEPEADGHGIAVRAMAEVLVRTALAANMAPQPLARLAVNKAMRDATNRRIKFDDVVAAAQNMLAPLGMALETLPPKRSGSSEPLYMLVLTLLPAAKQVLYQQDLQAYAADAIVYGDAAAERARQLVGPATDGEMVVQGILATVLCVLVANQNAMLERDLYAVLAEFGLQAVEQAVLHNHVDVSLPQLIHQFVRLEYLVMNVDKVEGADSVVEYALGRRAVAEFPPSLVLSMLQELYGEADDTQKEVFVRTLQDVYLGWAQDPEPQAEPTTTA